MILGMNQIQVLNSFNSYKNYSFIAWIKPEFECSDKQITEL